MHGEQSRIRQLQREIVFDQYQRYRMVELIVQKMREGAGGRRFTVLEVGADSHCNLGRFLPGDAITYSEVILPANVPPGERFIAVDATDMHPIADGAYDLVVACDVFEHIPKEKREQVVSEMARVAKVGAVLCFPFDSPLTQSAERRVNEYFRSFSGSELPMLKEHIELGLPNLEELRAVLFEKKYPYHMLLHGDIHLWEMLIAAQTYATVTKDCLPYQQTIDDYYNAQLFTKDISENNYRAFCILCADEGMLDAVRTVGASFSGEVSDREMLFLEKRLDGMQNVARLMAEGVRKASGKGQYSASLYFDTGEGFQDHQALRRPYAMREGFLFDETYDLPEGVQTLRWDPLEGRGCVVAQLRLEGAGQGARCFPLNGRRIGELFVFASDDPQIQIKPDAGCRRIRIIAQIALCSEMALRSIEQTYDVRLNEKENTLREYEKQLEDSEAEARRYRQHYSDAMGQLAQARQAHGAILQSTSWKVTRPFRALTNAARRVVRSNRLLHLCAKGARSLLQHGVRDTWRRVKGYRQRRKAVKGRDYFSVKPDERIRQQRHVFAPSYQISILVPLYNTPLPFLKELLASVLGQTYPNWQLCLADGSDRENPPLQAICEEYARKDERILYKKLGENRGISGNTNAALEMAQGEYIALLDHDDLLHPSALYEVMTAICGQNADFIYTDEIKFSKDPAQAFEPHFKPDFAADTLRTNNYICHLTVFRASLLQDGEGYRSECDGSQDYDMVLRLTERAKRIVHIPKLLYFWRVHQQSVASSVGAKPYVMKAAKTALTDHLRRIGLEGEVEDGIVATTYRIRYALKGAPLVSIVIPNKDHVEDLSRCIDSIIEKTTYQNYEIIIVENNSEQRETFAYYDALSLRGNIRIERWDGPFNFSAINNYAVKRAKGEYLLFLNNDTQVIAPNWVEEMLMFAQREDVGAVGAMLYYPDDTVQHAGVGLGIGGIAGHFHKSFPRSDHGYMSRLTYAQNLSAVTAACMMVRRDVFEEVEGFYEGLAVAFNDVDLCLKIRRRGYLVVFTPYAQLYHYESKSRGHEDTAEKQDRFLREQICFRERWNEELDRGDPYYNPNLTLDSEDFSIK